MPRRPPGGASSRCYDGGDSSTGRDDRRQRLPSLERLRIVLVEFLPSGGMFQFSFQFAAALAKAGHDVPLITGPEPELTSSVDGLEICSLLPTWHPNAEIAAGGMRRRFRRVGRALRLLESWRRVLGYLRRERPDVAQFGELRFVLDTAALLVVARLARQTAIVDVAHNPLPYDVTSKTQSVEKGGRLTRWLLGRAYAACSVVLVLGEGPKQDLLREFPAIDRVAVCGHGDYSSVLGIGRGASTVGGAAECAAVRRLDQVQEHPAACWTHSSWSGPRFRRRP